MKADVKISQFYPLGAAGTHTVEKCVVRHGTNLLLRLAGHGHGQQLQPRHGLGPLLSLALLGLRPRARSVPPGAGQNQTSPAASARRRSAELEGGRQELLVLLVRVVLRNTSG